MGFLRRLASMDGYDFANWIVAFGAVIALFGVIAVRVFGDLGTGIGLVAGGLLWTVSGMMLARRTYRENGGD